MMNVNGSDGLSPRTLQTALAGANPPLVVDVRDFPEFASGHIANARCLPLHSLPVLPKEEPIVCVCRTGRRSTQAVATLTALGFTTVEQLAGGMEAWEKAGLPVDRATHAPWALERQVRFTAGLLILLGLGLSHVWPPAIVLAWFIPAGLVFAAVTDSCAMGMLIARMPWNRPT